MKCVMDSQHVAPHRKAKKGLNVLSASIFIVGEMAGSGVLALPKAIVNAGWIGLVLLLIFCLNAIYGGTKLGACWEILEERYPEYRAKTRNPYSLIALKATGKLGSKLVSSCITITLFGAGTVYLLLSSQIVQELLTGSFYNASSCVYFIGIAVVLAPAMWLGSPKEFRIVGLCALLTTLVACILFFIEMVKDAPSRIHTVRHEVHNFRDFFIAFGTLLFAFGGASTFPTIQNDMEDKKKFSKSVFIALTVVILIYLPITAAGYFIYGEDVGENFAITLPKTQIVAVANTLMAMHLIFAFLIVINPVCQEMEESFSVPNNFSWKRIILRSSIVLAMILIGESIPEFLKILALIGGSSVTLLTFVFPPVFYMLLCSQKHESWENRNIPLHEKVYMYELIFIGLLGGGASTYSAIQAIFGEDSFTKPCYWP